jgi:hypothetical protein
MSYKGYIFISIFLISIGVSAQITQGGPPDDELRKTDTVNWKVDDESILKIINPKIKKLLPSLEKGLKHCVLSKKQEVKIQDLSDFFKVYLGQSFIELIQKKNHLEACIQEDLNQATCSKPKSENDCLKEEQAHTKCMKKKIDQKYLKEVLGTSALKRFIEVQLKVSSKEAEALVKKLEELEIK